MIRDVTSALRASGLDPRSLIIELTETAIMRNMPDVVRRLLALKAMGSGWPSTTSAPGYSSLAYLQQFPVDTIKIDRSFISSMADSPESGALIRNLVQLGKTLGLETLAEGIEASGQYSQLGANTATVARATSSPGHWRPAPWSTSEPPGRRPSTPSSPER